MVRADWSGGGMQALGTPGRDLVRLAGIEPTTLGFGEHGPRIALNSISDKIVDLKEHFLVFVRDVT
jgi:hypothetical protein